MIIGCPVHLHVSGTKSSGYSSRDDFHGLGWHYPDWRERGFEQVDENQTLILEIYR